MLKKVLIAVAVLLVALLAFAATRPDSYHVERATNIGAPAEQIMGRISDFHNWGAWSPWAKLDPAMKTTFSGPASGVGAVYEWVGNKDVGKGKMTVLEVSGAQTVKVQIQFMEPFPSEAVATFTLTPEGPGTKVVWAMDGASNYMAKVMGIFVSMDAMIGGDFEKGLASLKAVAEKG